MLGRRAFGPAGFSTNAHCVTVNGGPTAQVRDPKATDPSLGGWVIGHSTQCVNVDSRAHYTVKVTNVTCTGI